VRLGGVDLKPDLFVDLERRGQRLRLWCETDMATQGRKRMMQKFGLYVAARGRLSAAELQAWNPWPMVLFIAVDEARRRELNYLLRDVGEDDRRMFMGTTREICPDCCYLSSLSRGTESISIDLSRRLIYIDR
jgi:hypothetical protein